MLREARYLVITPMLRGARAWCALRGRRGAAPSRHLVATRLRVRTAAGAVRYLVITPMAGAVRYLVITPWQAQYVWCKADP